MTSAREQNLRVAQRKMLRSIVQVQRRPVERVTDEADDDSNSEEDQEAGEEQDVCNELQYESWQDWICRATHISLEVANKFRITDWVREQRARRWNLAGHTSRREDGRWSTKLLTWGPQGCRAVGHPVTRWRDAIKDFHTAACGWMIPWQESASKRDWWKQLGA
eukprot:8309832-Karenia_brevis.AAC.1